MGNSAITSIEHKPVAQPAATMEAQPSPFVTKRSEVDKFGTDNKDEELLATWDSSFSRQSTAELSKDHPHIKKHWEGGGWV